MKPYPTYKESGITWLGEIPAHWKMVRLRHLAYLINEKANGSSENTFQIALENIEGFTGRLIGKGEFGGAGNRFVRGDVLFNKLRPYLCKAVIAPEDGAAVGELLILRPTNQLNNKFLLYRLLSDDFISIVDGSTYGAKMPRASWEFIGNLKIPTPPTEEQQAIADYLDRKTAVIDSLIAKKERQIALLQEQRTAVINHAVTKGLNPHAPRKDSGIPWLGQIPTHWVVTPLKFVTEIQTGLTLGNRYDNEETTTRPYLRVANVQDGYLDLETITTIEIPVNKVERYELQFGDVLMTEGGDFDKLGRGFIWEGQIEGCLHQNHVFAVRPAQEKILPHFLAALTTSSHGKNYFTRTSQQTTNLATINKTKLGQFPLLLPPVAEQQEILKHIKQRTSKLDEAIENVQALIDNFTEYRTAVISAAVTGKIDVRPSS